MKGGHLQYRYTFGQAVLPARPKADGPRSLFILGAYPSALHVKWKAPDGIFQINALAVENEPEPFWDGSDERLHVDKWLANSSFLPDWGQIKTCGRLNGSSGQWVRDKVLIPLKAARENAWITDCLDIYHESEKAAARLESKTVVNFFHSHGIPVRYLPAHPSEGEIVNTARTQHAQRLLAELESARPDRIVTLGNAALRVLLLLADSSTSKINRLSDKSYGEPFRIQIMGNKVEWLPLAHPAAPDSYQKAHEAWIKCKS